MRHQRRGNPFGNRCMLASIATLAPSAHASAPTIDKGDTAWMIVATLLVVLMIVPGLALFYGGLVRAKNILSVLMQVLVVAALALVLWIAYGYSIAFDHGNAVFGDLAKIFLRGVTPASASATFTPNVQIPELIYIAFQGAFAAISCALVVGAIAERAKFAAVLVFTALWFTFAYLPIAHMVWAGNGFLYTKGALDFAGGTVVHINAGVAGLVGAWMLGPRIGFGRERLSPHSLPLTFCGAGLLWSDGSDSTQAPRLKPTASRRWLSSTHWSRRLLRYSRGAQSRRICADAHRCSARLRAQCRDWSRSRRPAEQSASPARW
jgi:uncharacterized protein with PQ loop repeat